MDYPVTIRKPNVAPWPYRVQRDCLYDVVEMSCVATKKDVLSRFLTQEYTIPELRTLVFDTSWVFEREAKWSGNFLERANFDHVTLEVWISRVHVLTVDEILTAMHVPFDDLPLRLSDKVAYLQRKLAQWRLMIGR